MVAPVLGVVVYGLLGIALSRAALGSDEGWSPDNTIAVVASLGAGLAYAVLLLVRFSPLGPILAGAAFLGLTGWAIGDPSSFTDALPGDLPGSSATILAPALPFTAVLAVPLLATAVSARRWRRAPYPSDDAQSYGATMPQAGGPTVPLAGAAGAPTPYGPPGGTPYGGPPYSGPPYSGPPYNQEESPTLPLPNPEHGPATPYGRPPPPSYP